MKFNQINDWREQEWLKKKYLRRLPKTGKKIYIKGVWSVKKEIEYTLAQNEKGIKGKIPFYTSATRRE